MSSPLIDPFGAQPHLASRIAGLGGSDPSSDTSYVFHTLDVQPALGERTFTIRFDDLKATCGALILQITTVSSYVGAEPTALRTMTVALADLVQAGGVQELSFQCRRNMHYAVTGNIYDETDVTAAAIFITLDRWETFGRESASPNESAGHVAPQLPVAGVADVSATALLISRDAPVLRHPVSQGWTPAQCGEAPFAEWMSLLRQPAQQTPANWELAYILQALRGYGALREGASGMGLGVMAGPLPALLAALGCTVLAAARHDDELPDADPGLALEGLQRPEICPPARFFDLVHFTTINVADPPESLSNFDFAWSVGLADGAATSGESPQLIENSMRCLKPGGVIVHVLQWAEVGGPVPGGGFAISRSDIERIALDLVSRNHEVAQLKFGLGQNRHDENAAIPFGLIARRG